jgi:TetR/AcrR family transcriptional regulator, cholesterol catabolism regulator
VFLPLHLLPERKKMSEIKDKILTGSETLFMRYGFKSITMDDVARELGVSKKTLYQFFADKNDLVNQCVEHYLQNMNRICDFITQTKDRDAITVMLDIAESVNTMIRQVNPSSMFDLKKYFKHSWDKLESDRKGFIRKSLEENFDFGVKKGLYRKDLDRDTIADIYIYLVGMLTDPDHYTGTNMNITNMYLEIMKYHLRSICTPKGHEILEERLKQLKK